jgi:dienelactone hydrolase
MPLGLLSLALLIAAAPAPASGADGSHGPPSSTTEEVSFTSDGLTLHGTVLVPADGDGVHPAAVLVAGSGARTRDAYLAEARALTASGVITLIYDKRSVGYSLTERSYAQLGEDAMAGLRLLLSRDDVDPSRAGLWGHSEGGWVVPLAASNAGVGFVVIVGASAVPPAEVQAWSTCAHLVHSGFPESLCEPIGVNPTRLLVSAGMFPEADYDPVPAFDRLHVPTLVLLAEHDQSTAPVSSGELFSSLLSEDVGSHVCVVPGADHEFRASSDGFSSAEAFAPGYLELAGVWVAALGTASFECPSAEPAQQSGSPTPLQSLAWYESIAAQVIVVCWVLAALLSYPITALVRRLRGRRGRPVAAASARFVVLAGVGTVLGTVCLLGYLMATGATEPIGPTVLGRPVVWLALQSLAVAAIAAAVTTAATWWRRRREVGTGHAVRLGAVLAAAVLLLPWVAWWGLLTI